jgi:hypothetical protein
MLAVGWTVVAAAASAQGPPPFELDSDASRSTQVVRMQLGLRDRDGFGPNETVFEARSPSAATSRAPRGRGA